METTHTYISAIKRLIGKDDLSEALKQLQALFANSPRLDEIILQSARFEAIRKHIREGTVNTEEKNIELSKIRAGIMDLLRSFEETANQPELGVELQKATKTIIQQAPKIYNIDHIDNANFY